MSSAINFNDTTPAPPSGSQNIKWQTDGSGNNSAYIKQGMIPLEKQTAAGVSELDFLSTLSAAYDTYLVTFSGITVSGAPTMNLQVTSNGGASYDTGSNYYTSQLSWSSGGVGAGGPGTGTSILILPLNGRTITNAANLHSSGFMYIHIPSGLYPEFNGSFQSPDSGSSNPQSVDMRARYNSTTAITGFKLNISAGTFSGKICTYALN